MGPVRKGVEMLVISAQIARSQERLQERKLLNGRAGVSLSSGSFLWGEDAGGSWTAGSPLEDI